MKKFKFLVMEDNEEYMLGLRLKADSYKKDRKYSEIELLHAKNLPSAKENFNRDGYTIQTIILDVVNYKDEDQTTADESCLPVARDYFREKASHLPIAARSGQPGMYETIKKSWAGSIEVFSKSDDEEKMLDYLIREVKKQADSKIIKKHSDVFEITGRYMGTEAHGRLLTCLRNMESPDISVITGTLSNLRKLQEYFYLAINKIDDQMIPVDFIHCNRTNINNEGIIRNLMGHPRYSEKENKMLPTTTEYVSYYSKERRLLDLVYRGCSEEIHVSDSNTTKYTVQSLVFAFMDLVLWLKEIANSKK